MVNEHYASRLGALLTLAGVAIGLANVWRFPYMMGLYGGSAFVVVYLVVLILLAVPVLMAEWTLGRAVPGDPMEAYRQTLGGAGRWLGRILMFGMFVAVSYYIVVIGSVLYATGFALVFGFSETTMGQYRAGLGQGWLQYLCAIVVLAAGAVVLRAGLSAGIERVSRLFVPFFGIVVVYLLIHALSLPEVLPSLGQFLQPDFTLIGPTEIFAATGQAAFSVGIGGTIMVVYGGYLTETTRIPAAALATGLADASAALLAAMFIVPTVFAFGLNLGVGPALVFETLPLLFAAMPGGAAAGPAFLLALTLMAFLSALGGLAVCASGLRRLGLRDEAGLFPVLVGVVLVLMAPSAFYPPLIGHLDLIFGSGMQVFGAIVAVLAVTLGLGRRPAGRMLFDGIPAGLARLLWPWLRWVTPAVLAAILLGYIVEQFR